MLKELHFLEDIHGADVGLHFLRTKDGKELDFAIQINHKITHMIEVKWADSNYIKTFDFFEQHIQGAKKIHLVRELKRESSYPNGVQVRDVVTWLAHINLTT